MALTIENAEITIKGKIIVTGNQEVMTKDVLSAAAPVIDEFIAESKQRRNHREDKHSIEMKYLHAEEQATAAAARRRKK